MLDKWEALGKYVGSVVLASVGTTHNEIMPHNAMSCRAELFQVMVTSSYGQADFRQDVDRPDIDQCQSAVTLHRKEKRNTSV